MTSLWSLRASMWMHFSYIATLVLVDVPFSYQLGFADEDQYKAQRWGVPAQASAAAELQVGDLYAVVVGVSKY